MELNKAGTTCHLVDIANVIYHKLLNYHFFQTSAIASTALAAAFEEVFIYECDIVKWGRYTKFPYYYLR